MSFMNAQISLHMQKQREKKVCQSLQWSIAQQEEMHSVVFTPILT